VTNVIYTKNEPLEQLVSPTKNKNKKREREHNTETMGVASRGF